MSREAAPLYTEGMRKMRTDTPEERTKTARAIIKSTRKDVGAGRMYNKLDEENERLSFHELMPPPTYEEAMAESLAGRPTKYRPDYHPRKAYQIITGTPGVFVPIRMVASMLGINHTTLYEWLKDKEKKEFANAITHAHAWQEASMAHHLTNTKYAQGTIFALKNMHADYWKDKIETETTVKLGDVIRDGETERNAVAWHDVIDVPARALPIPEDGEDSD